MPSSRKTVWWIGWTVLIAAVTACATFSGIRSVTREECFAARRLAERRVAYVPAPAAEDAYAQGNRAFALKQYDAAINRYSQALRLDSRYAAAYVARGNAELAAMRYDQALADYNRAIAVDAAYADAYFARGTIFWLFGRLEYAESNYRQVIQLEPEDGFYYDRLARVLYDGEKTAEVQALYEKTFRDNPCREWALSGWLGAIAGGEDFKELSQTTSALKGVTNSAAVPYYAGLAELQKKNYRQAREEFEQALKADPDHTPIDTYAYLAEAHRKLGNAEAYKENLLAYYDRTGADLPGLVENDIPKDVTRALRDVIIDGGTINTIAFAPNGGWVVDGNKRFWRRGLPDDLDRKLVELNDHRSAIQTVAFSPTGGWVVIYDFNDFDYRGIPSKLVDALLELQRDRTDKKIRTVAFAPNGGWVVVFGRSGYWLSRGIPQKLADKLSKLNHDGVGIKSITVTPTGGWIVAWDQGNWDCRCQIQVQDTLHVWNEEKKSIDVISFTPKGGWVVYSKELAQILSSQAPKGGN